MSEPLTLRVNERTALLIDGLGVARLTFLLAVPFYRARSLRAAEFEIAPGDFETLRAAVARAPWLPRDPDVAELRREVSRAARAAGIGAAVADTSFAPAGAAPEQIEAAPTPQRRDKSPKSREDRAVRRPVYPRVSVVDALPLG